MEPVAEQERRPRPQAPPLPPPHLPRQRENRKAALMNMQSGQQRLIMKTGIMNSRPRQRPMQQPPELLLPCTLRSPQLCCRCCCCCGGGCSEVTAVAPDVSRLAVNAACRAASSSYAYTAAAAGGAEQHGEVPQPTAHMIELAMKDMK